MAENIATVPSTSKKEDTICTNFYPFRASRSISPIMIRDIAAAPRTKSRSARIILSWRSMLEVRIDETAESVRALCSDEIEKLNSKQVSSSYYLFLVE